MMVWQMEQCGSGCYRQDLFRDVLLKASPDGPVSMAWVVVIVEVQAADALF